MAVRGGSTAAENYQEPDWETAVPKAPSDMQERFADWLVEKAGDDIEAAYKVDLEKKQQLSAFRAGIILGTRFRMKFQASPENQEASAPEEEAPAPKKATKAKKAAPVEEDEPAPKKTRGKAAKKSAPVVEEDEDDEEEAPAPKAKATAKASKGKRGGKAAF